MPPTTRRPILRPEPELGRTPLPVGIRGPQLPDGGQPGTVEFRYWNLAEVLRRTADFWGPLLAPGTKWQSQVGPALLATLDAGDNLNAFYDREGVSFWHHTTNGITVYSGESPDVVAHEVGHAVLDAIRPQLWSVASAETDGFHESFGDISAILTHLTLPTMRTAVIAETSGRVSGSSQVSRLAEQMAWAIRQRRPASVEADCMRNAANNFFYQNPLTLPTEAPAAALSRESHSFSRVFTGAFFRALGGIFQDQDSQGPDALLEAARIAGQLLVAAVTTAPIVPAYYAQLAAHLIAEDRVAHDGRYGNSLRRAFIRHGILSPREAAGLEEGDLDGRSVGLFGDAEEPELTAHSVDGAEFGLDRPLSFILPANRTRFAVAGAAPEAGSADASPPDLVGNSYVEDLFRRDQVATPAQEHTEGPHPRHYTHKIIENGDEFRLERRLFACGARV
ncbi:hypothetical protein [Paractinoplanes rishiriensis]|uniref:hypothetical protein n=1 Tax=Paractinoplanes rishiriensis TaxID=1050105 RepID=UPI0019439373|nr:hypothetical protein [Actinoplanes rishiriensis]